MINKHLKSLYTVLALCICLLACAKKTWNASVTILAHIPLAQHEHIIYPWERNPKDSSLLIKAAHDLHLGTDTYSDVLKHLGYPDKTQHLFILTWFGKKDRGFEFEYYLRIENPQASNADRKVELFFTPDGILSMVAFNWIK